MYSNVCISEKLFVEFFIKEWSNVHCQMLTICNFSVAVWSHYLMLIVVHGNIAISNNYQFPLSNRHDLREKRFDGTHLPKVERFLQETWTGVSGNFKTF